MHSANKYYLLILLLWVSFSAQAIDPNSKLPIQIESDRASLNDQTGISNYSGNVIISQGLSRLEADNISVNAIDRNIVSIKASGKPAHFTQQNDALSPATHGYGNAIIYVAKENLLRFLGEAKLVQADNSFAGEEIEYDILQRAIRAKGDEAQGSRVKIHYYPQGNSPTLDSEPDNASVQLPSAPLIKNPTLHPNVSEVPQESVNAEPQATINAEPQASINIEPQASINIEPQASSEGTPPAEPTVIEP
jgi:lipopolysaccharide export system protein LptA